MRRHWTKWWWGFVAWIISAADPLHDGAPYMMCDVDAVDDAIRRDFETMPYHLFQENYRDILTKYLAHLSRVRNADGTRKYADNTVRAYISSIRSFFTTEAASVKLQNGKVPKVVRARDEHVFTHD